MGRGQRVPACHQDARRVLAHLRIPHSEVISVDHDSILYLTPEPKEPRTAWLHRDPISQHLSHKVVKGFPVEQPCWPSSQTSPSSDDPSPPAQ